MQTIKRDIYVTKNVLQAPIEVTEGTNSIAIEFDVRDYDIPASAAAVAYSLSTSSMEEPNKALADVSENKITIIPSEAFFLPGQNVMQIRIIDGNSKLISFNIIVKCTGKMRFGDEKEEQQSTLIEQILAKLGEYTGELDVERKRIDKLDSTKANKTDLTSPYNFKGSCLSSALPASGNTVNDTYYCTDLKYRKTWNGSAWEQSSLNEADYEDELTKTNGEVSSLKEDIVGLGYVAKGKYSKQPDNSRIIHINIKETKEVVVTGDKKYQYIKVIAFDESWTNYGEVNFKNNIAYIKVDPRATMLQVAMSYAVSEDIEFSVYEKNKTYDLTNRVFEDVRTDVTDNNNFLININNSHPNVYKLTSFDLANSKVYNNKKLLGYDTTTFLPLLTDDENQRKTIIFEIPYNLKYIKFKQTMFDKANQICIYTPNKQAYITNASFGFYIEQKEDYFYLNCNTTRAEGGYTNVAITLDKYDILESSDVVLEYTPMLGVNCFNSIGALGDSYTAGSTQHSDNTTWTDQTNQSYIATLGKRAGIEWHNYGIGGTSTRTYLTNGMNNVLSDKPLDFYMLAFGINDCSLGSDYIGSILDIKDNYNDNADTFYGNYGKIIQQLKNHAPNCKMVLIQLQIPNDGEITQQVNDAIKEIANHYKIPFINPYDDNFFKSTAYATRPGGHPTPLTYSGMGLAYERLLSKAMNDNYLYFLYSTVG